MSAIRSTSAITFAIVVRFNVSPFRFECSPQRIGGPPGKLGTFVSSFTPDGRDRSDSPRMLTRGRLPRLDAYPRMLTYRVARGVMGVLTISWTTGGFYTLSACRYWAMVVYPSVSVDFNRSWL